MASTIDDLPHYGAGLQYIAALDPLTGSTATRYRSIHPARCARDGVDRGRAASAGTGDRAAAWGGAGWRGTTQEERSSRLTIVIVRQWFDKIFHLPTLSENVP